MDISWIVTEVDGKVASIAANYRQLPHIATEVAALPPEEVGSIGTRKICTEELIEFAKFLTWDDLRLFGTPFQISVWKKLYELEPRLYSYSDLAEMVDNPAGVRAVAHAVALNPVAYVIPCHLIVPKETIDRAQEIRESALGTLFKGKDLYLLDSIDVGAYAYGPELKRQFIKMQLAQQPL